MSASDAILPLRVGARTIGHVRRRLVRLSVPLEQGLASAGLVLPPLPADADGYMIHALPARSLESLGEGKLRRFVRQSYSRCYAALDIGFDAYLAGFSAKLRSTLRRKLRRFVERSGGAIDLRCYRTPAELDEFYRDARAVSALTYQEKRLGAGLPDGPEALRDMQARARRDAVRGWILFLDDAPVSYLYAPAESESLLYAFLGYDPAFADLSPGAVLQIEAMRMAMEERRFRLFDFTEGEGQHKRQFATGTLDCVDLLLLRPTLGNAIVGHGLTLFDRAVDAAKRAAGLLGLERLARAHLR